MRLSPVVALMLCTVTPMLSAQTQSKDLATKASLTKQVVDMDFRSSIRIFEQNGKIPSEVRGSTFNPRNDLLLIMDDERAQAFANAVTPSGPNTKATPSVISALRRLKIVVTMKDPRYPRVMAAETLFAEPAQHELGAVIGRLNVQDLFSEIGLVPNDALFSFKVTLLGRDDLEVISNPFKKSLIASLLPAAKTRIDLSFKNAIQLFEDDGDDRTEIDVRRSSNFDPRDDLVVVLNGETAKSYAGSVKDLLGGAGVESAINKLRLIVSVQEPGIKELRAETLITRATQLGEDYVLARFKAEDLFSEFGKIRSDALLTVKVNFPYDRYLDHDTYEVFSIPFEKVLTVHRTLLDGVKVALPALQQEGQPAKFTSIANIAPVSFVDFNEPLQFEVSGNLKIKKEMLLDDGQTWVEKELDYIRHEVGQMVVDADLQVNRTYRYSFLRKHGKEEENVLRPARQFVVDDYGSVVFVPVSGLKFTDKVLLPLVVPIGNKPNTNGSSFQMGPGISFPIAYLNPRPKGSAVTGVRNLKVKFGLTIAALREAEEADDSTTETTEDEEYIPYIGPWVSFFDFLQLGAAWKMEGTISGKPTTYLGFSAIDILEWIK